MLISEGIYLSEKLGREVTAEEVKESVNLKRRARLTGLQADCQEDDEGDDQREHGAQGAGHHDGASLHGVFSFPAAAARYAS